VAIYVDRTASVKTIIDRMLWLIDRGYNLDNTKNSCDKDESSSISKLIADYYGESHSFTKGAKAGVFPHYADLPNGIKIAVEYAIRNNKLNFIVCTTTLAQGVNIPIRYLFMTSIMTSRNKMQIRNFQNLIGRTARSGMYTEGSIIITNTKLYDERNKYKGGGKYRWDECIDMFNPTNNEPCGSSILALTKGIVADYETSASGMKIAQYIIEHFFQEHCFENLTEELTNWYEQRHPDRKSDSIFIEIKFREKITEAIENHLCYIFANNLSDDYYVQANAACKQTLAYALANDEEKELLINIFKVITDKIISIATKEQIANYSRTVIGIDLSQKISEWLTEKEICMIFYSETQLLDMILDFFYSTHDGFKKISKDQFKEICSYWIDGFMYCDIVRKLGIKNIKDVEYLCGKKISFELSFFIGNIIDMFVSSDDDVNPYFMLTSLQKKVKYGVNSNTAISICEAIFNDRRISNLIADYLNNTDIKPDEIIEVVKNSRVKIENLIDLYPSFYKERIALL